MIQFRIFFQKAKQFFFNRGIILTKAITETYAKNVTYPQRGLKTEILLLLFSKGFQSSRDRVDASSKRGGVGGSQALPKCKESLAYMLIFKCTFLWSAGRFLTN